MDGKEALYRLRNLLNEDADSGFLDNRTSYTWLYAAALKYVERTNALQGTQTITTVSDTISYKLDAEFLKLWLMTDDNEYYIKYNDGSTTHFLTELDYSDIIYTNNTTSVSIPSHFAVINDALPSRVTGTATSTATASGGECTLTDTAGDFSDVEAGDIAHNVTDGSDGVVLSKTSTTALLTSLFGGTNNDWTSSDSYVIQPQGRMKIVIDPPPLTSGHTITVYYIQKPKPVFSDYGGYSVQSQHWDAFIKYAAFLYKYRDREPDFGNAWYRVWDDEIRNANYQLGKRSLRNKIGFSFKARR